MVHSPKRGLGNLGEALAARMLAGKGYRVITRNWRCPMGELDVIAQDGDCLVFVEVRTRRGEMLGSPEESITRAKQARLVALAESYTQECGWERDWRIDVVAIELDMRGRLIRVDHYESAVTG
jgi:putative endonuclease